MIYLSDDMTPEELQEAAAEQREEQRQDRALARYRSLQAQIQVQAPPERPFRPSGPWGVPDEEDTFPDTVWY